MNTTRRRLIALALTLPAGVALGGCTRMYRHHGYVPADDELAQVVVGQTVRDELPGLIGRPGAQGVLTGSSWYYVGSRWELYGPREPREVSREVVAIRFDPAGTVSNVERFGLERGRVVVLSQRVTETGIEGLSVIGQLLKNVGNFSAGQILDAP